MGAFSAKNHMALVNNGSNKTHILKATNAGKRAKHYSL